MLIWIIIKKIQAEKVLTWGKKNKPTTTITFQNKCRGMCTHKLTKLKKKYGKY